MNTDNATEEFRKYVAMEAKHARRNATRELRNVADEVRRMLADCENDAPSEARAEHVARNTVGTLASACVAYAKWSSFAALAAAAAERP